MTGKPTEEGWFWEWRTFGAIPESVVERLARYDVRGARDVENADLYFVSSLTEQNVKLRADGAMLKLKPRLVRLADGLELYEETMRLLFAMPAEPRAVTMAAGLLGVTAPVDTPVDADAFAALLDTPAVRSVRARKRRTQYSVGDGWVELADVEFPREAVRSIGMQSRSLDETRRIRELLDPNLELAPVNYVEACRRWSD